MQLKPLEFKDRPVIKKYLSLEKHNLSNFSFANILAWQGLFDILWGIWDDSLCVFFKNPIGCFMYLPAQGKRITRELIDKTFEVMDKENQDKNISRIENVESKDLDFYRKLGFKCAFKNSEYVYKNNDLIYLAGDRFKSKRSAYNYFLNNYSSSYIEFDIQMRDACLALYSNWQQERREKYNDPIYQQMLDDSYHVHAFSIDHYKELDLFGRVVKVDNEIKAYSFGCRLNEDTLCILLEVADLGLKGLSQFIFREICRENNNMNFVNTLDDSDLDNLRRTKLSYNPYKLEHSYTVSRGEFAN